MDKHTRKCFPCLGHGRAFSSGADIGGKVSVLLTHTHTHTHTRTHIRCHIRAHTHVHTRAAGDKVDRAQGCHRVVQVRGYRAGAKDQCVTCCAHAEWQCVICCGDDAPRALTPPPGTAGFSPANQNPTNPDIACKGLTLAFWDFPKPSVVAVHGDALGRVKRVFCVFVGVASKKLGSSE